MQSCTKIHTISVKYWTQDPMALYLNPTPSQPYVGNMVNYLQTSFFWNPSYTTDSKMRRDMTLTPTYNVIILSDSKY